ncbi:Alpha/Beta hydrolase protein [Penicillium lividum]|nr:Alpha/Beta hydrolase protein [Penicillium lividum]
MSPTYHAHAPNAGAFLLLHVQRQGDIRQAVELAAALNAAGTDTAVHVFEGKGFEGHVQMLLQLGDPAYAATLVMDNWLNMHVPVN